MQWGARGALHGMGAVTAGGDNINIYSIIILEEWWNVQIEL